jgi:antitoxin MazE
MNTTIRNIGNSKGIILPKNILTQCDIDTDVSIEVKDHRIIITASPVPKRKGWEKAFREMAKNEDDALIIPEIFNDENTDDWTWK